MSFISGKIYSFHVCLQFYESFSENSRCHLWLKGKHPNVHDGVVSRKLCMKRQCSTIYDVYVRRCAGQYVYNFKDLHKISSDMTFCFKNGKWFAIAALCMTDLIDRSIDWEKSMA